MPERHTGRGLVAAGLAACLMPLNSTMIAVAVPDIGAELHHDPGTVTQALVATYLVAAIALQSTGGRLGDRLGQWRVLTIGQAVLGIGALLGFIGASLWVLAASRVLMAAGGAIVVPATIALIRLELPSDGRGRAFGMFGAAMALSAGIGPIVGGELVHIFGWESIFLSNLPVLALSVLLAAGVRHVPTPMRAATPFDWLGSSLLIAVLSILILGLQVSGPASVMLLAVGGLLCVPFVSVQRRVSDPVVSFALFRSAPFTAGTLLIALLNLVMYALLFEIPLVLGALFPLDARQTGRLLVFFLLAMVGASVVAGRLTDRFGARPVALAGTLIGLAGIGALLAAPLESAGQMRAPLVLLGVGLGLANPAAQAASLAHVSRERSGMAAGVSSTMRYLGGIVGVAILGRVLDSDGSRASVIAQHHALLAVFVAVLLSGLVCVRFLPGHDHASDVGTARDVSE
ncbi:MAG: permease of the major facilitator superfamily [Nocardioidaceae bacterium]|nr:permease of the major facilitator superfamily [Nocardioidaceae bacterium]